MLDQAYSELESIFVRTCKQVIGTRVKSASTKHWFSYPGIKAAYWSMKRTRRVWKRSRVPCAVKAGAALMAMDTWKALVREAKAASWSRLCADIQSTPKSKLQWTLFKQSRGRVSSPLNHLCDHFVAASVPPALDADSMDSTIEADYLQPRLCPTSETGSSALPPHESDEWTFTPAAVEEQCTFQHTNSAPGCDAFLPILLKHAGKSLYAALSNLFTYSWRHAVLPQQWTEANVMALYKGKGARSQPASYRPISMTSIIIRTFEHLIHNGCWCCWRRRRSFTHCSSASAPTTPRSTPSATCSTTHARNTSSRAPRVGRVQPSFSTSKRRSTGSGTRSCYRRSSVQASLAERGSGCTPSCLAVASVQCMAITNPNGAVWNTVYRRAPCSAHCCSTSSSTH